MIKKKIFLFILSLLMIYSLFANETGDNEFKIKPVLIAVYNVDKNLSSETCRKILASLISNNKNPNSQFDAEILTAPELKVNLGQKARFIMSSEAQYLLPISSDNKTYKLCTLPYSKSPGTELQLQLSKSDNTDLYNLEFEVTIKVISDRENLHGVTLDVGKPLIASTMVSNKVRIKTDTWNFISKNNLNLGNNRKAALLIAVKVIKN